jgi:hypothetical protein
MGMLPTIPSQSILENNNSINNHSRINSESRFNVSPPKFSIADLTKINSKVTIAGLEGHASSVAPTSASNA